MLRNIVGLLLAVLLIAGGYMAYKKLSFKPERNKKPVTKLVKNVFVEEVKNRDIPVEIMSTGQLTATRKITLTSEVTGVLKSSTFKEGVPYRKGQTIFVIDDRENAAAIISNRSSFYSTLLNIMPDLKLDYPEVWDKWDNYVKSIDINNSLPSLPEFTSEREENFINGRGVISAYNNVKNQAIRLGKFVLTAPISGVITTANVEEGSLITMGQNLGEISSIGDYELELPINIELLEFLKTGQQIELENINGTEKYSGKLVRINPKADAGTQSLIAYVRVVNDKLREGMYLKAKVNAGIIKDAIKIDRKLINNNNQVFVVEQDSILALADVNPVYIENDEAIIKGLPDGTALVSKALTGAYSGVKVNIVNTSNPK